MLVFCSSLHYHSMILTGEPMSSQKIKDAYSDDVRLALLEQSIVNINNTLVRFERRFDQLDAKIDSNNKWTVGLVSGLYILLGSAFITVLIKLVH